MRVLVTGGSGFIGSALCLHLIELGHEVVNVDALTYAANPASLLKLEDDARYGFEKADIRDRGAMNAILARHEPGALVHLAAESHVDRSIDGARIFIDTNVIGTFTLLEAVRAHLGADEARRDGFRFLHVSTDEVYGSLGEDGLFSEASRYEPSSPYSASKAASDHLAMAWHHTYGLPAIVSNCSNNYGPRQFPEKLIPLVILNALEGRELPVYGDGGNVRDWLHVEDHARALAMVLARGKPGQRYNIGGRNERKNIDVVKAICGVMDWVRPANAPHANLIRFVTDRPGHDRRYAIDATKVESELGWQARETFETGIEKTVRWYLDNETWWSPLRQRVYGGERLGTVGA
ncbi:MAG: dTDP-glucose 4,6-dehydratase [Rhizobiaceae bacterium]